MRPMIEVVTNTYQGHKVLGAEIGVSIGENAEDILKNINMEKLYLIDSYPIYTNESTVNGQKYNKDKAFERLSGYKNAEFVYLDSVQASLNIKNESLDFVYIDANHRYEGITSDIQCWFPKVKEGGIIGGHDFDGREDTHAVYRAVCELAIPMDYEVSFRQSDWWIIK